jgi:hypothetical protein
MSPEMKKDCCTFRFVEGGGGGLFSNAFSFPFPPVVSLQQIHYSLFPKERTEISQDAIILNKLLC